MCMAWHDKAYLTRLMMMMMITQQSAAQRSDVATYCVAGNSACPDLHRGVLKQVVIYQNFPSILGVHVPIHLFSLEPEMISVS